MDDQASAGDGSRLMAPSWGIGSGTTRTSRIKVRGGALAWLISTDSAAPESISGRAWSEG
jgi:hypothetical protein